ncbi:MAG: hypothetical protein U1F36_00935 [Planctomycetota bacterium]
MKPLPLALDDLPPLRVPLRFFLTAPLFGVIAGLVVLVQGDTVLLSRWQPQAIQVTHLFTLGFLLMVMIGALFQVVPVLLGRGIPAALRVAQVVHPLLTVGSLALAFGLGGPTPSLVELGAVSLALALVVFVPLLAWRVLRRARGGDALFTIRFAVLALLCTVALGLWMAAGIAWPALGIAYRNVTDVHAGFGLFGWVLLMIMGVSQQVVPMFHVTPPFPAAVARSCGAATFAALVVLAFASTPLVVASGEIAIAAAGLAWSMSLLLLLKRRRRRRSDATVFAWQLAGSVLVATALLTLVRTLAPALVVPWLPPHRQTLLLGVLSLLGVASTVVLGMLPKILAFLGFTHLQRRCLKTPTAIPLLPTMDDLFPMPGALAQIALHAVTLVVCVTALFAASLVRIAGALLVADFALCAILLGMAALRYGRASSAIARHVAGASAGPVQAAAMR